MRKDMQEMQVAGGMSFATCHLQLATCHQVQSRFDKYFTSPYNLWTVIVSRRRPLNGRTADPINE